MPQLLLKIFLALLLVAGFVLPVTAGPSTVSGDMSLRMAGYRGEVGGVEVEKVTSMVQQYTLVTSKNGAIGDRRLGTFTLLFGMEFNILNAERQHFGISDAEVGRISTHKFFYNTDILLAPGGLPFRLNLFARDLKRTAAVGRNFGGVNVGPQGADLHSGHLVDSEVPVDLDNGTHQVYGATLLLGIRNGSYLGAYRDVLSQLPRLLIDYKQEDVKNLHSIYSPTHYRNRDLAFISLNKKDNWIHVRMRDYTDYLNDDNNKNYGQVMIGTIDHRMTRQWINLTNWIRISGDFSLDSEKESYWGTQQVANRNNLFVVMQGRGMNGGVYSSFVREKRGDAIKLSADLPVSFSIELDRDTFIRTRLLVDAQKETALQGITPVSEDFSSANESSQRHVYLDIQPELRRTREVVVKPRAEIEQRNEGGGRQGVALRLGSEVSSNSRRSDFWLAGYSLTTMQSEGAEGRRRYLQHDLYGSFEEEVSHNLLAGVRALLAIGTGKDQEVGFRLPIMARGGIENSGNNNGDGGTATRSHIELFLEHRHQLLQNRLDCGFDFFTGNDTTEQRMNLGHALTYSRMWHSFQWSSALSYGDGMENPRSVDFDYISEGAVQSVENRPNWSSRATYGYHPGRSFSLNLNSAVSGGQSQAYSLSEEISYKLYTSNGVIRQLALLSESLSYEKSSNAALSRASTLAGALSAAYFPFRYLQLRISTELVRFLENDAMQQINSASIHLGYDRLKLIASYSKGQKDRESESLPVVAEERWDINIKKIF